MKFLTRSVKYLRSYSTLSSNLFLVEQKQKEYAVFKLNKPPVNSLNLESLIELNKQLDKFENDQDLKGIIFTSNVPNLFSAGVDILEMYKCEAERLKIFWTNVQDFWLKLYSSKKIYIAAINGHALAFGCVIAMSCDYRLMVDSEKAKIGLNAVLLGINAPSWFKETMENTIGLRETEKSLQFGKIYNPKQALNIGLVDELIEEKRLVERAESLLEIWTKIPSLARARTKLSLRENTLNRLNSNRDKDLNDFIQSTQDPLLQKNLEIYLNNLKQNKNK